MAGHVHERHWHHLAFLGTSERFGWTFAVLMAVTLIALLVGAASASLPLLINGVWVALLAVGWRLSSRPPSGRFTFGLGRVPHLMQLVIGFVLLELGAVSLYFGIDRLIEPVSVNAGAVLATSVAAGLVVAVCAWILARSPETGAEFTIGVAFQQLRSEIVSFAAAATGAALVLATGWTRFDTAAGLIVTALVLADATENLHDATLFMLEAAPEGIDPHEIGIAIAHHAGVLEVHDLHVWGVAHGFPALSAHVLVGRDADCHDIRRTLEAMIWDRFGVNHTTLQVEHEGGHLLEIEISPGSES